MQYWDADFINRSPLFEPLRACGVTGVHGAVSCSARSAQWPEMTALQAMVNARGIVTGGGQPLRLVAQDARGGAFEDRYEVRIYREGELQLRAHHWHDLFNLLAWMVFPRAKAALNARHHHALLEQQASGTRNRGAAQDALTLFDESGVIVAATEPDLLQAVRDFEWKRLFWEHRERVIHRTRWFIFGHALYEKALQPYEGITGRGVLFNVERGFPALPLAAQLDLIDGMLAQRLAAPAFFTATRELAPVPILGIPGWWAANGQASFYDNTAYFRPGRQRA